MCNGQNTLPPQLPYLNLPPPPSPSLSKPLQPHPHSLGEHLTLCLIDQPTVEHSSGMVSTLFSVALRHLGKAHSPLPRQSRQSHRAIDRFRVACAERQPSIPPQELAHTEKKWIGRAERQRGRRERVRGLKAAVKGVLE